MKQKRRRETRKHVERHVMVAGTVSLILVCPFLSPFVYLSLSPFLFSIALTLVCTARKIDVL
jgi:hypothetical protein